MKRHAAMITVIASMALSIPTTEAQIIQGYPDVILCDGRKHRIVLRIDRLMHDGSAIYKDMQGRVATVGRDRIFRREGAVDCDGMTLEALRDAGKTRSSVWR